MLMIREHGLKALIRLQLCSIWMPEGVCLCAVGQSPHPAPNKDLLGAPAKSLLGGSLLAASKAWPRIQLRSLSPIPARRVSGIAPKCLPATFGNVDG
jgi:hypothetical protein